MPDYLFSPWNTIHQLVPLNCTGFLGKQEVRQCAVFTVKISLITAFTERILTVLQQRITSSGRLLAATLIPANSECGILLHYLYKGLAWVTVPFHSNTACYLAWSDYKVFSGYSHVEEEAIETCICAHTCLCGHMYLCHVFSQLDCSPFIYLRLFS